MSCGYLRQHCGVGVGLVLVIGIGLGCGRGGVLILVVDQVLASSRNQSLGLARVFVRVIGLKF